MIAATSSSLRSLARLSRASVSVRKYSMESMSIANPVPVPNKPAMHSGNMCSFVTTMSPPLYSEKPMSPATRTKESPNQLPTSVYLEMHFRAYK
ncbi:hypothetical protein SARC_14061 [Sphaeroforma arctica JP610]|uniref:Uncharacterized protein n=1 Tax=Sphaeroforma arctica JP610 TaxID=667725 RepID=A0A0L0FBB0_9EUKA|nr:hypothetical protein SARC_14061 [Sphaeroforma arctica JP610]KNC73378.1 hypothetical protein SARC_14061 [Sphaeroforma arctica JP610]|eukprot:XP_014147280.1 hypothetical protein SARC_14061 [Sphaeroforma arctica JP610]